MKPFDELTKREQVQEIADLCVDITSRKDGYPNAEQRGLLVRNADVPKGIKPLRGLSLEELSQRFSPTEAGRTAYETVRTTMEQKAKKLLEQPLENFFSGNHH